MCDCDWENNEFCPHCEVRYLRRRVKTLEELILLIAPKELPRAVTGENCVNPDE